MRHRSKQMWSDYVIRRSIVARVLNTHGGGVVCWACNSAAATDPHERHSRGRGGSIVDGDNIIPLCRSCHSWVTEHPEWAQERGWALVSGDTRHDFYPDDVGHFCSVCQQPAMSWRHR